MECIVLKRCYREGRCYKKGDKISLPDKTPLGSVFKLASEVEAEAKKAKAPRKPEAEQI